MTHYKFTLACFTSGLICFMLSALLYGWMQFDWSLAMPMTVLLAYFLVSICKYFIRIYRRFRLPPECVVTGAFNADASADSEAEAVAQQEEALRSAQLQAQLASLPESVRANMDIVAAFDGEFLRYTSHSRPQCRLGADGPVGRIKYDAASHRHAAVSRRVRC